MSEHVFLTDGRKFLGPYVTGLEGRHDLAEGRRWLREVEGATDVYSVRAETLTEAKRARRSAKDKGEASN